MNTRKLLCATVAAIFGLGCLDTFTVSGQSPDDSSLNAVITSDSGGQRYLQGHRDYIGRAGLRPQQMVQITLQCPKCEPEDPVSVLSLDGGRIMPATEPRRVNSEGTASFQFEGGLHAGLYRVRIETGGQQYFLEFYVLDLENPANNPPRVYVLD